MLRGVGLSGLKGIEAKKSGKNINKEAQTNEMKAEISELEDMEDVTKYGEFVSSYFAWISPEKQKKRAKEIENMTDR